MAADIPDILLAALAKFSDNADGIVCFLCDEHIINIAYWIKSVKFYRYFFPELTGKRPLKDPKML
jgi:hypothetical protein